MTMRRAIADSARRITHRLLPSLRITRYKSITSYSLNPHGMFFEISRGRDQRLPYIRLYVNKTFGQFPRGDP